MPLIPRNRPVRYVAALILFLSAVLGILHLSISQRAVFRLVASAIRKSAGIEIKASDVSYSIIRGTVMLRNLSLRTASDERSEPFAEISSVSLRFNPLSIGSGIDSVKFVRIDNPALNIRIGPGGEMNLPISDSSAPFNWSSLPQEIQIQNGSLNLKNERRGWNLEIPHWDLEAREEMDDLGWSFELSEPATVETESHHALIEECRIAGRIESSDLSVQLLEVRLGKSTLSAEGKVLNLQHPVLDLRANAQMDLDEISTILFPENVVAGNLDIEAEIQGPPGEIDLRASAQYSGIRFAGIDPLAGSFESRYSEDSSYLYISDLKASSASGDISATASFSLSEQESPSYLRADLSKINIERIMQIMNRKQDISGSASGTVECQWPGMDWKRAGIRGRLQVRGSGSGIPLNGSIDFGWNGQVAEIRSENLSGPGFRLRGMVEAGVSTQEVSGELFGEIENGGQMLRALRGSRPETFSNMPEEIDGSVQWHIRLDGTRDAPRIMAAVESGNLSIGNVREIGIAGELTYQSGRVEFQDIDVSLMKQDVHVSGSFDMAAGDSPAVEFRASVKDGSLRDLLDATGLEFPADGRIAMDIEGSGPVVDPEIQVSLEIQELETWEEPLGTLTASARVAGSQLTLDALRLRKPQRDGAGVLEASGALDWKEDILQLRMRGEDFRIESWARPDDSSFEGVFSLDARADGFLSDPSWILNLEGRDLSLMGLEVGSVEGSFHGSRTRSLLELEAPDLGVSANGDILLSAPFPARLTVDAPKFDIGIFRQWLGDAVSFEGSMAAHIESEGPLAHLEECTVNAVLNDLNIVASGQEIRGNSSLEAEWTDGSLVLKPFTLVSGEAELKISGSLPLDDGTPPGEIQINGGVPLSAVFNLLPALKDYKGEGRLEVEGSIGGTLRKIQPRLNVFVDDAGLSIPGLATELTDVTVRATASPSGIKLERFEGRFADGSIRAEAVVPLPLIFRGTVDTPASAVIVAEKINPAVLLGGSNTAGGSISLRADLESPDFDLRNLRGSVTFPELSLIAGKAVAEQVGTTSFRVAGGRLSVENFALSGPGTTLNIKGYVGLLDNLTVDLEVDGKLESEFLRPATSDFRVAGPVEVLLKMEGSLPDVSIRGSAHLHNGRFTLPVPPLSAEAVNVEAEFDGRIIRLKKATGVMNGGQFEGGGELAFSEAGIDNVRVEARARNIFLDYPRGLQTVSNLDLRLRSDGDFYIIEGDVQILEGTHREAIDLRSMAQNTTVASPEANPELEKIRLNVRIQTEGPISVDNNLARVDGYADLRLAGTANRPTLLGRMELEEGGQAYISQRVFDITRAVLRFTNEQRIEPRIDLSAETYVQDYVITIKASGGLKDLETSFTSNPPASREQIQSLLITGSVDNADKMTGTSLASHGAISLFGSTAAGGVNLRLQRALGFSQFRIEPNLIALDSDPTARLTVGQNFTPELGITYSTNLTNSNDSIWIAHYDWRREILGRYISRSQNTDRAEMRHRIHFGGGPGTGDTRRRGSERGYRLEELQIGGDTVFPKQIVTKELGLKLGSRYDFSKIRRATERLARYYGEKGYHEASIRQESRRDNNSLRLSIDIVPGPVVSFEFSGADVPNSLKEEVGKAWRNGLGESERLRRSAESIRSHFIRKKHADAHVSAEAEYEGQNEKKIRFTIDPGPPYRKILWEFPGLPGSLSHDLESLLKNRRLDPGSETNRMMIPETISRHLRELGYLTCRVEAPRIERDPEAGVYKTVIGISTGPAYRLNDVIFEGNEAMASEILKKSLNLSRGEEYLPVRLEEWMQIIGDIYWRKGFRDASVTVIEKPYPESGNIDLIFRIRENLQATIAGINIEGNVKTGGDFLLRRIPFEMGQEVDGEKLELLRRRLLNTGVYNSADINLTPSANGRSPSGSTQPLDLHVQVREPKPFGLEYGLTYDSERKTGFVVDASVRNMLGEGRTLGYRILADRDKRDQRFYFSQPFLSRRDITTTLDIGDENSIIEDLEIEKIGLTIQQQVEFRRKFTLHYGYRLRRTESRLPTMAQTQDPEVTSSLILALSHDSRDGVFDSSRGSYLSQSFEYGPKSLGGNLPYYRYYGQFFKYFGLSRPDKIPFGEERRSRFVFATGIRAGLMDTLQAETASPGERFFGGGGSTIRGFKQNSLGPQLEDGQPVGGQALLFLNNELRMPAYKFVDAAAFLDVGNVYDTVSDFSFSGLRASAGLGLRIRNPFILLRFDYGFKLNRREGESRGAFHFGIGQAF